jgi:hypothetical protein
MQPAKVLIRLNGLYYVKSCRRIKNQHYNHLGLLYNGKDIEESRSKCRLACNKACELYGNALTRVAILKWGKCNEVLLNTNDTGGSPASLHLSHKFLIKKNSGCTCPKYSSHFLEIISYNGIARGHTNDRS